jgi:hypothetical protein
MNIEHLNNKTENAYVLNLTDTNFPLFHYNCVISHTDFHKLKTTLDLVVDFEGFPKQINELLTQCSKKAKKSVHFCTFVIEVDKSRVGTGNFDHDYPHVDEDHGWRRFIPKQAVLQVGEKGSFRNLLHLKLEFSELDDYTVKQKLLGEIDLIKKERLHSLEVTIPSLNKTIK